MIVAEIEAEIGAEIGGTIEAAPAGGTAAVPRTRPGSSSR
jgi:hypothetical protein